ncbi:Uncharacterised protein [Mycobacteroides abscessus subsp. massiliense]|nr:Uncharacterised protein [Mycobacteroides abscessus subsp. massiliense]
MVDEFHRGDREDVTGDHPGGDRPRDRVRQIRFQIDVNDVGPAALRGSQIVDRTDEHALKFDVRFRGKTVAHVRELRHHTHIVVETAGRLDDQGGASRFQRSSARSPPPAPRASVWRHHRIRSITWSLPSANAACSTYRFGHANPSDVTPITGMYRTYSSTYYALPNFSESRFIFAVRLRRTACAVHS